MRWSILAALLVFVLLLPAQVINTGHHRMITGGGGGGAPTVVTADCVGLGISGGTTPSFNATGGNAIIGAWFGYGVAPPTVTDDQGNTVTAVGSAPFGFTTDVSVRLFYEENPTSMGAGHTLSIATTGSYSGVCYAVLSGMKTSGLYAGSVNGVNNNSSGTCTPGSQAASGNNVVFEIVGTSNGSTASISDGTFNSLSNVAYGSSGGIFGGRGFYKVNAGTVNPDLVTDATSTACSSAIFIGN
jgi:hypothetical protein